MTAYQLRNLDQLRLECEGAFANRAAKALDKKGKKYLYKQVSDYINFEEEERKILGNEPTKHSNVDKEMAKRIAQFNMKGG